MVIICTKEENFHNLSSILFFFLFLFWQFNHMSEWELRFHRHFGSLVVSQTQLHFIIFISIIMEKSSYTFIYKNKNVFMYSQLSNYFPSVYKLACCWCGHSNKFNSRYFWSTSKYKKNILCMTEGQNIEKLWCTGV